MRNSAMRGNFCLLFRRNTLLKLVKLHHMCDWNAAWGMTPRFCSASSHLLPELCVDASGEIRTVSPVLFVEWRKHAYFMKYIVCSATGGRISLIHRCTYNSACLLHFQFYFVIRSCTQPATFATMTMQLWYHWHNRLQAHRTFPTWVSIASATALGNTYSEQYDSVTHFIWIEFFRHFFIFFLAKFQTKIQIVSKHLHIFSHILYVQLSAQFHWICISLM